MDYKKQFDTARILLLSLGMFSRKEILSAKLLNHKKELFCNFINMLDELPTRHCLKIGVIYVAKG